LSSISHPFFQESDVLETLRVFRVRDTLAGGTRVQNPAESCPEADHIVGDLLTWPWSVIDRHLNSMQVLVLDWE
jgi:hypothetical protein